MGIMKRTSVFIAFLLSSCLLVGCQKTGQIQIMSGFAQGTTWHISVWDEEPLNTNKLKELVVKELERLDKLLSNYRSDSVIEQFNTRKTTEPVNVGAEIVNLIQNAESVSEASQGHYDLTIRPLYDLWGFSGDHLTPPEEQTMREVLSAIGYRKLHLLPPDCIGKVAPEIRVDLSSIAQGYSVGCISMLLENAGVENYIVEIGGELMTRGCKPDGSPWRIGIERPLPEGRSIQKIMTIERDAPLAVMTSGTYRHYFDEHGRRYSHILDAKTGKPVDHQTVSVTVVNDSPTMADAWSTALLCLGADKGKDIAEKAGIAALFITETDNGLAELTTSAWKTMKNVIVQ